jgi:L-rhamnose isomerase
MFHSGVFAVSYINHRGMKISKYLSNESGFIEIGQKLIELWRWKGHVFPLQLVFSKRFFRFLTFLWAVYKLRIRKSLKLIPIVESLK